MNPFELLKDIDAMKKNLANVQEELAQITATGSSGGNIDICEDLQRLRGRQRAKQNMLEDLIVAAHHDAMAKIQDEIKNKFGPMLGGLQGLV